METTSAISLPALFEAAIKAPTTTVDGLWDLYKGYAFRSRKERKRMKALLKPVLAAPDIIDVRTLFSLPEAWRAYNAYYQVPALAFIPLAEREVFYQGGMFFLENHSNKAFLTIPHGNKDGGGHSYRAKAVPVPKSVLPFGSFFRDLYVVQDTTWMQVIPVDPYLVERKSAHHFKILAHWDLTEKERQLMALLDK